MRTAGHRFEHAPPPHFGEGLARVTGSVRLPDRGLWPVLTITAAESYSPSRDTRLRRCPRRYL